MQVRILTETELRDCVTIDASAVDIVAKAFSALAGGQVVMPPVLRLDIPDHNGEIDVKTAYVPGLDSFAVKMSPGFFDNPKLGLLSVTGLMVLLSARTGLLEAVLLDNGYLTDVRTAAAGAVAARHLAPEEVATAGVIGAGIQARLQMHALKLVRPFRRLMVSARDPAKARAYAEEMGPLLNVEVVVAGNIEALMSASQVVVTTTPARSPLIPAAWLHPGLHITAMGSDSEHKNEVHPEVFGRIDRFVCDRRSQSQRLGEWHHALAAGLLPEDAAVDELGELTSGRRPGRSRDDEVTLCDLTGTGVQDTAIAVHAFRVATEKGLGISIEA